MVPRGVIRTDESKHLLSLLSELQSFDLVAASSNGAAIRLAASQSPRNRLHATNECHFRASDSLIFAVYKIDAISPRIASASSHFSDKANSIALT